MQNNDMTDPYNLKRFIDAQNPVYEHVLAELRDGDKTSHWMWFIFPQIEGLGRSDTAKKFAISSRREAEAYLHHPVLGTRLRECIRLVNQVEGRSAEDIFGHLDSLKFHSSLTLFVHTTPDNEVFQKAMQKYYKGEFDRSTLERL